jgi:hypothetical protein
VSASYRGVIYDRAATLWKATIQYEGKLVGLGHYRSEHEAAFAFNHGDLYYYGTLGQPNHIRAENRPSAQRQMEIKAKVESCLSKLHPPNRATSGNERDHVR